MTQTPLADARKLLGNCSLFGGLSADELKVLVAQARIRNCAAGETVFLMGSAGDSLMAVLSGEVGISIASPEGREIRLAVFAAGDFFGEIAVFDGKERSANAVAMTACRLAVLERADVLAFFARHPGAWPKLVAALCGRLRQTDHQVVEVALLPSPVRLAKALTRIAGVQPEAAGRQVRLSQTELGKIVGATRETVNRCFRDWQRAGIIEIEEGVITILDQAALEQLAELG